MTQPNAQDDGLHLAYLKSKTPLLPPQNAADPGQVPTRLFDHRQEAAHVPMGIYRFEHGAAGTWRSAANAHPTPHGLPTPVAAQARPRLVIVEDQGGFVIRCETPRGPQAPTFPQGAIPLGASVRIDRAALPHSNQKDKDHGEIR